ncbi:MAG: orotate phosphoribosyltransferase [Magnetococcus sp. WYHC-3]
MKEQDILALLRETGGLLSGHFELRSGLHSNRFFQCANVLRYPRVAEKLCAELVARMLSELGSKRVDGVIAPALGGILVGHEVARALDVRSIFAEKQDGKLVMRRFTMQPGERYIVAEDVITRGGRVQETIDLVRAAGAEVVAVAVLVDRSAGAAKFDYPTFSLLHMAPQVWEPAVCPLCEQGSKPVHPGS